MDKLIKGRWYWTSNNGKDWWPLKYRGEGDLIWSNDDCIYEYKGDDVVKFWKLIPLPEEVKVK